MRKAVKALLELKANHGLEIESLSTEVVFEGITYVLTFKRKD